MQNAEQTQSGQQAGESSQLGTDLAAIGSALQAGDIISAQSAFATLTQDVQSVQQAQGGQQTYASHGHHHHHHGEEDSQTTASSLSSDLAAVGSALQSSDVTSAQSAFATLMQDLGSAGGQNATGNSSPASSKLAGSNINTIV